MNDQGRVVSSHLVVTRVGLATRRSDRGTFTPKDGRLAMRNKRGGHNCRAHRLEPSLAPDLKNRKRTKTSPGPTSAANDTNG
jgi:hypothetical protein